MSPKAKVPLLGSISFSKNYAFVGYGRPDASVGHSHVSVTNSWSLKFGSDTPPDYRVTLAIQTLFKQAPDIVSIVVSAFGPFRLLGRNNMTGNHPDIGIFSQSDCHWSNFNLYTSVINEITSIRNEADFSHSHAAFPIVQIEHDVNMAALGEHYYHFDRKYKGPPSKRSANANLNSVYIKVSNTVNAGFVSNGQLCRSKHHPQFGSFRLARLIGKESDTKTPCCEFHGDSISGYLSVHALEHRTGVSFSSIPEEHICWDFAALYLAEFCLHLIFALQPRRIALGGRVVTGPNSYDAGWEPFIKKVRAFLADSLLFHAKYSRLMLYDELLNLESFLGYRDSRYPSMFGGLVAALWNLDNHGENSQILRLHSD